VDEAATGPGLEFVKAAKRGDARAWAVLFKHFQPAVTSYCLTCTGGRRAEALDLTQDIFALAVEKLHQLEDLSRFQGWLFVIARNRCLRFGQRSAQAERAVTNLSLLLADEPPEDAAEREYWLRRVESAVQSVENESHRAVVTAHYGRGEKTRDIAERLGMPHGTVTVVLKRFRDRLKVELLSALAHQEPADVT
jgi:RNA polymerase sigma-70 factor (ECF subfamily)